MKTAFLVLATALMILSIYPYIRDIRRGKTRPNLVSWITWTMLSVIATTAAISAGEYVAAIFTAAVAVETITVILLGFRSGYVNYGWLEKVCQAGALIGLVLWWYFNSPAVAVIAVVIVDVIGAIPTMVHSWQRPFEETWSTYALAAAAAVFAILALTTYNWVSLPYTIYILVLNILFTTILISRGRHIQKSPLV